MIIGVSQNFFFRKLRKVFIKCYSFRTVSDNAEGKPKYQTYLVSKIRGKSLSDINLEEMSLKFGYIENDISPEKLKLHDPDFFHKDKQNVIINPGPMFYK